MDCDVFENSLKSYRLTSMEEPSDDQLTALMEQVGEDARESSRRAQAELRRRMEEVRKVIAAQRQIAS